MQSLSKLYHSSRINRYGGGATIIAAALIYLLARIYFVQRYEINWDEFFFLSQIYDFLSDRNSELFQRGHVYPFFWLAKIPGNEISQIVAGRYVMLALQLLNAIILYRICRLFSPSRSALLATALYLSFSYVNWQGASFRADSIAVTLIMAAYLLSLNPGQTPARPVSAGALIGCAGMVTIKSIFLVLPLFFILFFYTFETQGRRKQFFNIMITAGAAGATFLLLICAHASTISGTGSAITDGASAATALVKLQTAIRTFVDAESGASNGTYLLDSLQQDFVFWYVIACAVSLLLYNLIRPIRWTRYQALTLLCFALPLSTLGFYRNAYPYYYPFMLAPVAVLASVCLSALYASASSSFLVSSSAMLLAHILLRDLGFQEAIALLGAIVICFALLLFYRLETHRKSERRELAILAGFAFSVIYASQYTGLIWLFFFYGAIIATGGIVGSRLLRRHPRFSERRPGRPEVIAFTGLISIYCVHGVLHDSVVRPVEKNFSAQQEVVKMVHEIFPTPVPYIDRFGMISSFPRVGFFMSTAGLAKYKANQKVSLEYQIAEEKPRFLIADAGPSERAPDTGRRAIFRFPLLPRDEQVIRENYVPHWRQIFVAGKTVNIAPGQSRAVTEIIIDGPYTLESRESIRVDGVRVSPGDVTWLAPGSHVLEVETSPSEVTFRFGDHLYRPSKTRAGEVSRLYTGF